MSHTDDEVELYGDPKIASMDANISIWLKIFYVIVFSWGVIGTILYWNGAEGWIDRGYWFQLEKAANTTYPWHNADNPQVNEN
jgi:hypothetical protein